MVTCKKNEFDLNFPVGLKVSRLNLSPGLFSLNLWRRWEGGFSIQAKIGLDGLRWWAELCWWAELRWWAQNWKGTTTLGLVIISLVQKVWNATPALCIYQQVAQQMTQLQIWPLTLSHRDLAIWAVAESQDSHRTPINKKIITKLIFMNLH